MLGVIGSKFQWSVLILVLARRMECLDFRIVAVHQLKVLRLIFLMMIWTHSINEAKFCYSYFFSSSWAEIGNSILFSVLLSSIYWDVKSGVYLHYGEQLYQPAASLILNSGNVVLYYFNKEKFYSWLNVNTLLSKYFLLIWDWSLC